MLVFVAVAAIFDSSKTLIGLFVLAALLSFLNNGLSVLALSLGIHRSATLAQIPKLPAEALPVITLLVPLYREERIASELLLRLERIDYPRDRLEIRLIVEASDWQTQDMLSGAHLPDWVRTVFVPPGTIQTKPRALNLALDFSSGTIVGIYDAEDAPAPDQLQKVAAAFDQCGAHVACLQGKLNFYNSRSNWLTRCFAIDYALWFTMIMPTLRRIGWPVPLGGTTVFFRRAALEAVGAWDAHNVTEDADLGIRLARKGYVTELIDTTTLEEATVSLGAWMRQRSRWQKGYTQTLITHLRYPRDLLNDLGIWGALGMLVLLAGSLLGAFFGPLLWSLWLIFIAIPHPLTPFLASPGGHWLAVLFGVNLILSWTAMGVAVTRMDRPDLLSWVPTTMLYFPLMTGSLVKAIYEIFRRPFHWDKTDHGVSEADALCPPT
ncbi:glycosyltransferase family 2 protein [Palleronia caenipelagi]|nr:glycosyltransferase family 2 protein [Palleronia caenipelagi]